MSILFKILEDLNPQYIAVAFDLKAPTKRHELYEGYKATRKGMPDELASQLPIIKEILQTMNIKVIEQLGYEADDILGTMAKYAEKNNLEVIILSGDRDIFQLATDKITVRIPRTKLGKTETEDFNMDKVIQVYGVPPSELIEVKGLMGDSSDNIPGVPGIGEKTALDLIKKYKTIDNIYEELEKNDNNFTGKLKEKLENNKQLAYLSRELGKIDTKVPIKLNIEEIEVKDWDNGKLLEIFRKLNFNRFISRFNLMDTQKVSHKQNVDEQLFKIKEVLNKQDILKIKNYIMDSKKLVYYFKTEIENHQKYIIKEKITNISIYNEEKNIVYIINFNDEFIDLFKDIFADETIQKYGCKLKKDYILLRQIGLNLMGFTFDIEIATYLLNANMSKYKLEDITLQYLGIDVTEYLEQENSSQINLFDNIDNDKNKNELAIYAYCIGKLSNILIEKLININSLDLFQNIEMPTSQVLAQMQYTGIYINQQELRQYGLKLQERINILTQEIYNICDQSFNINSTKQLGEILFEKLKLKSYKKTKNGYSTDVDVLEKLKNDHPVIEKLLEYRQLTKLNSTYIEGLIQYINPYTNRIHSFFHQTVAATGRISSTDPNLQNIPTKIEIGKQLRKVFKPENGKIFIDADYSQIELRVLAHISEDKTMVRAFNDDEDIHSQAASKVFNIPLSEVTKGQRSNAKAVNFGIVYGISDFGLSEQLGVSKKEAKQYIEQYLEKYDGIKKFMERIVDSAKENGYVETIFKRRRYIPELNSNNYVVRQFGHRIALNTPIQGTAADIMKIAMLNVNKEFKKQKLNANIVLQIHDELLIEADKKESEKVKEILKKCMESVIKLKVPLKVEISEAENWYDTK